MIFMQSRCLEPETNDRPSCIPYLLSLKPREELHSVRISWAWNQGKTSMQSWSLEPESKATFMQSRSLKPETNGRPLCNPYLLSLKPRDGGPSCSPYLLSLKRREELQQSWYLDPETKGRPSCNPDLTSLKPPSCVPELLSMRPRKNLYSIPALLSLKPRIDLISLALNQGRSFINPDLLSLKTRVNFHAVLISRAWNHLKAMQIWNRGKTFIHALHVFSGSRDQDQHLFQGPREHLALREREDLPKIDR